MDQFIFDDDARWLVYQNRNLMVCTHLDDPAGLIRVYIMKENGSKTHVQVNHDDIERNERLWESMKLNSNEMIRMYNARPQAFRQMLFFAELAKALAIFEAYKGQLFSWELYSLTRRSLL